MNEYELRIKRVQDAVELKESDMLPIVPSVSGMPFFLSEDATYKDTYYNYPRAAEALVDFYSAFMPDAYTFTGMTSGRSNEIAGSTMIDWPGRPGTKVSDYSTHQVIEHEYMEPEEYPELINDFTGFMLRKYIPRAFPELAGLGSVNFVPSIVLSTKPLAGLYSPGALEAYDKLREIARYDKEADAATAKVIADVAALGIPAFFNGGAEAPFDIISDYYRGTVGMFSDLLECPDMIAAACDMFADIQIASFERFRNADMPFKRVFFPLHKGMDGFISPAQYEELYWKPLKKVVMALIDLDVTPVLFAEGAYNSRLECIADVPKGKVIYEFETIDIARAKEILGGVACIAGNFPVYLLEYGTKRQVIDEAKRLIDICAPGGGYIFNTDKYIENVKRENVEAMFDTVRTYGKK